MKRFFVLGGMWLGLCVGSGQVWAGPAIFDPASLNSSVSGPRTQVLVVGTPHLRQLPSSIGMDLFSLVQDRLTAYRPQIVTIEALSGESCYFLTAFSATYEGVADQYCKLYSQILPLARARLDLDVPQALTELDRTLARWPEHPTPAQRRHLAVLFGACGDPISALVQWLRLPESERVTDEVLSPEMMAFLQTLKESRSEHTQLAAVVAARNGLERVYATDDHTADRIQNLTDEGFEPAISALWQLPSSLSDESRKRTAALHTAQDVLDIYRFYNDPETGRQVVNGEWKNALSETSPEHYGRQYAAWWEVRNFRMVSNIRATFGNHPGERVMTIVGASHKPYFEAYLSRFHEVDLVDAEKILK